jgi:hypothetical protein
MNRSIKRSQLTIEQLDDRLCLSTMQGAPLVPLEVDARLSGTSHDTHMNHGVTALAWSRVDGVSPPSLPMAAWGEARDYSAIVFVGGWGASSYQYAFNDPLAPGRHSVQDDVIVDGRIITGENYDSADIASHGYIRIKKLNSGG